jgi:Na+-translocating ferredoxin:NAD+ oxidoreductase subunit B
VFGRDEAEIAAMVETMAGKGTVFDYTSSQGVRKYELTPLVPGAVRMIEKEENFAVMPCICRDQVGPNTAGPCKVAGAPRYSCISVGKVADYLIAHEFSDAKRITKEQCRQILEACNEGGLVQNVNNFVEGLQFICNCCPCCCTVVQQAKQLGPATAFNTANFAPAVDGGSCTGCGACVERCPMGAISLAEDVAAVDADACLGCGHCVPVCPVEALTMVRVSDKKPELAGKHFGLGSAEAFGGG